MNGPVNGYSTNGAALPNWVVRAVVVAVAAATVAVAPTRITYATAYGDAAVAVTLSQTHTIQARASGTAVAQVSVAPTLKFAGASSAQAASFGAGAVRRDVFAQAGGDATATGEALTAQAIGSAQATCSATVVAVAHIIHPGRAVQPCTGTGQGAGDVTRYPVVLAGFGEVVYTRGEASVKRNATSFYEQDGYVPPGLAWARASGEVPQDRVKIIATLGSFTFADSTAAARAFMVTPGRALGTGVTTAQAVVATHIQRPRVNASAQASGQATGTRVVLPQATAVADVIAYAPRGFIRHASTGSGTATATLVQATGKRTTFSWLIANASADLAGITQFGFQHRSTAEATADVTASARANARFAGRVQDSASASIGQAVATLIQAASVQATLASATVGRAYAVANSEVLAPDDRYMYVPPEPRDMFAAFEDRTMVVTA